LKKEQMQMDEDTDNRTDIEQIESNRAILKRLP